MKNFLAELKNKELLENEGHKIIKKGKKYVIVNFEKHLVKLK